MVNMILIVIVLVLVASVASTIEAKAQAQLQKQGNRDNFVSPSTTTSTVSSSTLSSDDSHSKVNEEAIADSYPNIIIVMMDDVGFNDLGFLDNADEIAQIREGKSFPHVDIHPPFWNSLAHRDSTIALTNYYTQSLCTPARASLLTGLLPVKHGLNHVLVPGTPAGLSTDIKILPEYLKELGYNTSCQGKWHIGSSQYKMTPIKRGFDAFTGIYGWDTDYYTKARYESPWEKELELDWTTQYKNGTNSYYQDPTKHSMQAITETAIYEINNRADAGRPLFLYLPFTAAHSPLQGDNLIDSTACDSIPHAVRKNFCQLIYSIDSSLRDVVEAVESKLTTTGRDTIMIIIADNGGSVWLGGSNYPLRGAKGGTFEGGLKVQGLIVEFPKSVPAKQGDDAHNKSAAAADPSSIFQKLNDPIFQFGRRAEYANVFHVSDWVPTILGMLGKHDMSKQQGFDGIDHSCNLPWTSSGLKSNCKSTFEIDNKKKYFEYRELLLEFLHPDENVFEDYVIAFRKNDLKLIEGNFADGFTYKPSSNNFVDYSFRGQTNTSTSYVKRLFQYVSIRLFELVTRGLESYFGKGESDTTRIFLQNSLLYKTMKYSGVGTQDGVLNTLLPNKYLNNTVHVKTWLFNVTADPSEHNNLANKFPDLVSQMRERANQIASKRVPQQKVWMQYRLDYYRANLLLPGSCPASTKSECKFVGPFISDDVLDPFDSEHIVGAMAYAKEKYDKVFRKLRNVILLMFMTISIFLLIPVLSRLSASQYIRNSRIFAGVSSRFQPFRGLAQGLAPMLQPYLHIEIYNRVFRINLNNNSLSSSSSLNIATAPVVGMRRVIDEIETEEFSSTNSSAASETSPKKSRSASASNTPHPPSNVQSPTEAGRTPKTKFAVPKSR